jgi:hypothetical protein
MLQTSMFCACASEHFVHMIYPKGLYYVIKYFHQIMLKNRVIERQIYLRHI